MAQTTLKPPPEVGPAREELPARAGRPRRSADRSRKRFAYWLIAPAVAFMVLIHLVPTAAGFVLSFKRLNTFTFSRLWDAPWTGLENYRGILFDSANPLHSGFLGAVQNTALYTFWKAAS